MSQSRILYMNLLRFRYTLKIPNPSSDIKSDSDLMHVLFRLFGDVITSFPLHHGTPLWQCCSDVHSDLTCEGACQIQWIGREDLHRKPWEKMGGVRRTFPQHQQEKSRTTSDYPAHKSAARHSIMFNSPEWFLRARFTVPCNDQSLLEGSSRPFL